MTGLTKYWRLIGDLRRTADMMIPAAKTAFVFRLAELKMREAADELERLLYALEDDGK